MKETTVVWSILIAFPKFFTRHLFFLGFQDDPCSTTVVRVAGLAILTFQKRWSASVNFHLSSISESPWKSLKMPWHLGWQVVSYGPNGFNYSSEKRSASLLEDWIFFMALFCTPWKPSVVMSDRGAEAASLLLGRKPSAQCGATDRWLLSYKLLPCNSMWQLILSQ